MDTKPLLLSCLNLVIWVDHTWFGYQLKTWLLFKWTCVTLAVWLNCKVKTWPALRVDNSVISVADRSVVMRAVRSYSFTAVCSYRSTGNRCAPRRPEKTGGSARPQHIMPQHHTITHTANRCHVLRHTTKYNIWDLNRPRMPQSSERPHKTNSSRMQQWCHVCMPHAGLMGVQKVKGPSWTQRQAETQPNVTHPLKSPPTRMLLHRHCLCMCLS